MLPGSLVTSTLYVTLAIHELGVLLLIGYVLVLTVLQLVKDRSCPSHYSWSGLHPHGPILAPEVGIHPPAI